MNRKLRQAASSRDDERMNKVWLVLVMPSLFDDDGLPF
jgi:hypothetical protein